jgi:hypothetical protein
MIQTAITGGNAAGGLFTAADIGTATELAGIRMSDVWDAADITVQASSDGVNYFDLYNDAGTAVALTVDAGRVVAIGALRPVMSKMRYFRLRSGTAAVPVVQTDSRTLYLLSFELSI